MAGHKIPGPAGTQATIPVLVSSWNYDPQKHLDDPGVNPLFAKAAKSVLDAAEAAGLRPRVHEAYRSSERSDVLYKKWQAGKGSRAAPGWASCHNYGLAMDVYLYDATGKYIDNHVKGWYKEYKKLAKYARANGFVWGESFGDGDADHFEFHPNWPGGAGGDFLTRTRDWALELAEGGAGSWLDFFWWAAGAGGAAPESGAASPPSP